MKWSSMDVFLVYSTSTTVRDVLNNKVGEFNNPELGSTVADIQKIE
jgi:hypothetical protein